MYFHNYTTGCYVVEDTASYFNKQKRSCCEAIPSNIVPVSLILIRKIRKDGVARFNCCRGVLVQYLTIIVEKIKN